MPVKRTLLVEDNPSDALLIERMLRASSVDVSVASSLAHAVELLRRDSFDAVFLDLNLPDSSGLATLEAMLEPARRTAMVVLTGHDDEETAHRALSQGAQDYLIKGKTDAAMLIRSARYAFERKRADALLSASEERFRALVENSSDGIALLDAEGTILYSSPAIRRILGLQPEEFAGRCIFSLIHPEDLETVRECFRFVLGNSGRTAPATDVRYRHRDGTWRYIEVIRANRLDDPAVGAIVANYRDVTERRLALESVDQMRRQYELLLASIAEGVHGIDLSGTITFENPAAAAMLGWETSDLHGLSAHATIHHTNDDGTPHPLEDCPIHATLTDGIVRHIRDDLFWRRDGTSLRVEYVAAPMRDSDGRITGVVVVFHDVTREREMQQQVEQAIRVSSLGRIAASVAHEFNNVLMSILPFAEILMRTVGNDAALQRPLKHIMDATRRGKQVSHQILRFVNPAAPMMSSFDAAAWLNDFAEEAGTIVRDRAVEIVRSVGLPVRADAPQLAQVMTNLLTNARDATPAGSVLTLGAARADTLPFVARQIEHAERFAALFVRDRGAGIPAHVLERIFEPLFTTKKSGGTGLGLAVACQIMSEHGGKMLVETAPGAGSTFYITLPLEEP